MIHIIYAATMLARLASFCQTAETTSTGRPNGPEPLYRIRLSSSLNAYSICLRFGFCHIARSAPEDDHQRAVVAVIRKPPSDCRKRSPGRPDQTWFRATTSDLRPLNIRPSSHPSDIPAFTPAEAGTRLSDPGGMQG